MLPLHQLPLLSSLLLEVVVDVEAATCLMEHNDEEIKKSRKQQHKSFNHRNGITFKKANATTLMHGIDSCPLGIVLLLLPCQEHIVFLQHSSFHVMECCIAARVNNLLNVAIPCWNVIKTGPLHIVIAPVSVSLDNGTEIF